MTRCLLIFGLFVAMLPGCTEQRIAMRAAEGGRRAAADDLAAGRVALRRYGFGLGLEQPIYAKLLHDQLGVQLVPVAGCVVTVEIVASADAYNEVMTREIERRHGKGVLDRLYAEASAAARPDSPLETPSPAE